MSNRFAYDLVPYPSLTFPQTNPDRLATMAAYYGMKPASPQRSRVLELGCGDGTNLMSFAYIFPESSFVGIDLAESHIADADHAASAIGLRNVAFRQQDLIDIVPKDLGEFDFIIAHGLYSWVPGPVRERILEIYSTCLSPNGVGYISYNALPGSHFRQMAGEMMSFHIADAEASHEIVRNARDFLQFLADAAEPDSIYQSLIQAEAASITERDLSNVLHDDLAPVNQPFYFHEFVEQISARGLQFLSEADPWSMSLWNPKPEIASEFERLATDTLKREQYLDFITCRRFRSTLICRDDIGLSREADIEAVKQFFLASSIKAESDRPNLSDATVESFISPKGSKFQINHPLTKAVLVYLEMIWTKSVGFDELMVRAGELLARQNGAATDRIEVDRTAIFLSDLFKAGFVKFQSFQPQFVTQAGEFPKVSSFAAWQVSRGCQAITSLSGMNLESQDDHVKQLILLLDGTRNREAIAADLRLSVTSTNGDKAEFEKNLAEAIETNLAKLAEAGLLEA